MRRSLRCIQSYTCRMSDRNSMSDGFPPPPTRADRWGGALATRWPGLMRRLARLETASVRDDIADVAIDRPVYVCGMARSGSTVLLEMLAGAPGFVSLRYSDYPCHWLPYWWNALRARLPRAAPARIERAHRDRLAVGPDSPEAFEENWWQAFFPHRHDESVDQTLGADAASAPFAAFYRDQLRKLLAVRGGRRYLCKGNYHLARIECLLALFPDARFVVPVRAPRAQVASLCKQDRWFVRWSRHDARVGAHLARLGHYEFGPEKRVQHCGDDDAAAAIRDAWNGGDTAFGYALQWREIYGAFVRRLEADERLRRACLVVSYEALCTAPEREIRRIAAHAGLDAPAADALASDWTGRLSLPDYYTDDADAAQRARIEAVTGDVAASLARYTELSVTGR